MISDFNHKKLRKNHATGIPTTVVYLDTETTQKAQGDFIYHRMKLAWSCSVRYSSQGEIIHEKWTEHINTEKLWSYVERLARKRSTLYVFGHNIFFDLQCSDFFYYFEKWGWIHEFNYENGLTYILCLKKDNRRIKLLSTTNFFQTSLDKLGKMVGSPKGKVDFEKCTFNALSDYCRQDVLILKQTMEFYFKFVLDHDLGKFSMTQASQAFRAYRHRFMHEPVYLHDSLEVKELERLAYHGGRTEAFQWRDQKGGPFLTLDVNSMYPYIMKYHPVPMQLIAYEKKPSLRRVQRIVSKFSVVAECLIKTDIPCYAVKSEGKTIFPLGTFVAYLCTEGVKTAFEHGHLKRVNRFAAYRSAIIFDEYVDFFYTLKTKYHREKESVLEYMCKIFLNALYGKFGQKKILTSELEKATGGTYWKEKVYDLERSLWVDIYYLMNKVIVKYGTEDSPQSFAAISAHITEGARLYLWQLIEKVGHDKVIYCDTDSIKIRKRDVEPLLPLIDEYKLGCLKIDKRNKHLDIQGAKSYIADGERKVKGVPKGAEKVDTFKFKYYTFFKQATHLNQGIDRWYVTRETHKDVTPKYDKGIINADGSISPFRLELPSLPSEPLQ